MSLLRNSGAQIANQARLIDLRSLSPGDFNTVRPYARDSGTLPELIYLIIGQDSQEAQLELIAFHFPTGGSMWPCAAVGSGLGHRRACIGRSRRSKGKGVPLFGQSVSQEQANPTFCEELNSRDMPKKGGGRRAVTDASRWASLGIL